ncbi:hypothetical protein APHAL10511_001152 [Amanita phalloides]|nr:hypothetical protein APHAL10511_001152 [Amanita phalloides]
MPTTRRQLRQSTLLDFGREASSSRKSPPRTRRKTRMSPIVLDTSDSDDVIAIHFEDEEAPISSRTRATAKRRRSTRVIDSVSEDEPVVPVRKGKRRRIHSDSPDLVSHSSASDGEDLEEEVDKKSILATRFRARGKLTAFQKNLEKLKRKKQGKLTDRIPRPESDENSEPSESDDPKPFKGARPHDERDNLFSEGTDGSDSSSNFIVEDDGVIPQPLPAQFSMETHQDLPNQFKRVFQFFVHVAVHPPLERREFMFKQLKDEEYFSIPLRILRRKIMGLRDSLVTSSVWRSEYRKSLDTYPAFDLTQLGDAFPGCDACHLGGRKSTMGGRLSGTPYDKHGFEMIAAESDSDDESDSEKSHSLEYHLGRFCAKRTRVYHELTHWEYALFQTIRQEVDDLHAAEQSRGFIRVGYDKRPPKDLGDADGICEWLDKRKIIDMEWHRIKDAMESARHLDMIFGKEDVD